MNDPRRLLEGDADDFETLLLGSGREDHPSVTSRERIAAGVGLAGLFAAGTVATSASAASAASAVSTGKAWLSLTSVTALRIAGGALGGALALYAGYAALAPRPTPKPAPAVRVQATAPAPIRTPTPPTRAQPSSVVPPAERSAAPPIARAPAVERPSDTLSLELHALDRARAALSAGRPRSALTALDDYARRYPHGTLGTEARVLRIEALLRAGDRAAAARLGKAFIQNHPNGPYAKRVRSLVGDSTTDTRP